MDPPSTMPHQGTADPPIEILCARERHHKSAYERVGTGSIAAGIQAGLGNVAFGSSFALAQSIAMGGAAVPLFGVVAGGAILG
ncbi:hypothetical protein FPV67DRAFT_1780896, partial [Lyophyllum atratum]